VGGLEEVAKCICCGVGQGRRKEESMLFGVVAVGGASALGRSVGVESAEERGMVEDDIFHAVFDRYGREKIGCEEVGVGCVSCDKGSVEERDVVVRQAWVKLVGDVEVDCGSDLVGWDLIGDEEVVFDERSDFQGEW